MDARFSEVPLHARRARASLLHALRLRCPRCGSAPIYESVLRVRRQCPRCDLVLQREPGYFMGALYLNVIVTLSVLLFTLLVVLLLRPGVGLLFHRWMLVAAFVLPLALFRHSRAFWLALDYIASPPTDGERVAPEARGQSGPTETGA